MPRELGDAALCKWMGWGWLDLMAAPVQLVADLREWMRVEAALGKERESIERAKGRMG